MCIFCKIVAGHAPASLVHEDERFLAFMDLYPWRPGHVLVIPKAHCQYVAEMEQSHRQELFGLGTRIAEAVRASALTCDDLHLLINDGPMANQTVPHVHLHVVPRIRGDLWRLAWALSARLLISRLTAPSRAELDRHAALIRSELEQSAP